MKEEGIMKKKFIINQNPSFWKNKLSDKEFEVLINSGTDMAFDNKYYNNKKKGIYICAACNNVLFNSTDKYKSGSGWPSFNNVIFSDGVGTRSDHKLAQERTETYCNRCGAHLGHLFSDGPEPTGLRYCINSSSLKFLKNACLALGCFWSPDAKFGSLEGVYFTATGYTGGDKKNPSYHNLGNHTETVRIYFDPEVITFKDLLEVFLGKHVPSKKSYSKQYSSIIFYDSSGQKNVASDFLTKKKKVSDTKIYTEIKELKTFYEAEDYHQNYFLSQHSLMSAFRNSLLDSGERLTYSRIMTKLNAYCQGCLEKEVILQELDFSYLKLKNTKLIKQILNKL